MDPDTALLKLREAISQWEDTAGAHRGAHIDAASDMRDAAVALDEWLSRGGCLPAVWSPTVSVGRVTDSVTEYRTRALPATDTEPARIRVSHGTGSARAVLGTLPYPQGLDPRDAHLQALSQLLEGAGRTVRWSESDDVAETPTGYVVRVAGA